MTGSLSDIGWEELDRHHEQAKIAARDALLRADERAYRAAEGLERRCLDEKARRARDREPGSGLTAFTMRSF